MLYHWVLGKKNFEKQGMVSTVYLPLPFSPDLRAEDHDLFSFFLPFSFLLSLLLFWGVVVVLRRRPAEIPEPGVEFEPQQ